MCLFSFSMTIGYWRVSVILLTTKIARLQVLHKERSTNWAKSRPDGGVLLCESSVQVTLVRRTQKVNCILARAESEKPNELTLERNLRLITKQRKIFLPLRKFLRGCHDKKRVLNRFFRDTWFPSFEARDSGFYCVNQVYKSHSYEGHEKSIVYLRELKVRKTQRMDSTKKLELN